jgi:hypothetical protein
MGRTVGNNQPSVDDVAACLASHGRSVSQTVSLLSAEALKLPPVSDKAEEIKANSCLQYLKWLVSGLARNIGVVEPEIIIAPRGVDPYRGVAAPYSLIGRFCAPYSVELHAIFIQTGCQYADAYELVHKAFEHIDQYIDLGVMCLANKDILKEKERVQLNLPEEISRAALERYERLQGEPSCYDEYLDRARLIALSMLVNYIADQNAKGAWTLYPSMHRVVKSSLVETNGMIRWHDATLMVLEQRHSVLGERAKKEHEDRGRLPKFRLLARIQSKTSELLCGIERCHIKRHHGELEAKRAVLAEYRTALFAQYHDFSSQFNFSPKGLKLKVPQMRGGLADFLAFDGCRALIKGSPK